MGGTTEYLHSGFIIISLANLVVIGLLVLVFAAAVALRWPGTAPSTIEEDRAESWSEEGVA